LADTPRSSTGRSADTSPFEAETARVDEARAADAASAVSFDEGARVGRFVVIEEVGRGGMGVVLRAYDPKLQREVALKIVRDSTFSLPSISAGQQTHQLSPELRRLMKEARAMARLSHPNVVAVHDVEQFDAPQGEARLALVMELVSGQTLRTKLRNGSHSWQQIVALFRQAGRGLAAAHTAGLLHRDFKPANVLIANTVPETVKVTDFGLARLAGASSSSASRERGSRIEDDATQAGTVMGTPRYMSPEQHRGESLTAATDQYSFCISLWEALCGEAPFSGETMGSDKHRGPPPWPSSAAPAPIGAAIVRGLSVEPQHRWASMDELLAALDFDPARRRNRWLAAGGTLTMVALAGGAWRGWEARQLRPCSGAEAQLEAAWNDTRRQEIEEAFNSVEGAWARQAWERTEQDLDWYAEDWVAMHTDACEASTIRGEQSALTMDLRMTCLRRARLELEATTAELAAADRKLVLRSHQLTAGLPPLRRCEDVEALRAEVEPPRETEGEAVEHVRRLLARARASRRAGRFDHALQTVEAAQKEAEPLEYGPVRTEVFLDLGDILDDLGRYEEAEAALKDALRLAARWDQKAQMHRAATSLMYVVGYEQSKPEGLRYLELAEGLAGSDPLRRAATHNRRASIAFAEGDFELAEKQFRRALAAEDESGLPREGARASILGNIGLALHAQGKYEEAAKKQRRAIAIEEKLLGADHPGVAESRVNLGNTLYSMGRYDEAESEYRRALSASEAALGPDHPDVAMGINNVANVLYAQKKLPEAEREYRRAAEIWERALDPGHPYVVGTNSNLANVLDELGRTDEAEAFYRRAVELGTRSSGPKDLGVAAARNNLGTFLREQGRLEEAGAELRAALEIRQELLGPDHPDVATTQTNLAAALLQQGRFAEAVEAAEHAWPRRSAPDMPPQRTADTAFVLAKALWQARHDANSRARARELARRAATGYQQAGPNYAKRAEKVAAWLGAHPSRP
jgi:tetratricopeptide (TPR) repeat protein